MKAALASTDELLGAQWRKSAFSGGGGTGGGNCVEVAALSDGRIGVRDSKIPDAGVLLFTRTEMTAWLKGVKAGASDNHR